MSLSLPILPLDIPVAGGGLRACRLSSTDDGAATVVAVHGITSSSHAWLRVAHALDGRASLVAIDLRGRGRSNELPPPYGIGAHAADLLATLDHLGLDRATLVGHSLGAYIVARLAADHPERVNAAILVDGGLTIPGIEGVDPQEFADAFLGPAIARLRMTFADPESYREFWRAHPAFAPGLASGDVAEDDVSAYADYDLIGEPPDMRSCISEDAVRADAGELLTMGEPAHRLAVRATLMHAPRGLLDDPKPMQPRSLVADWVAEAPDRRTAIEVPDVNHYTITFGSHGADAVAQVLAATVATVDRSAESRY